MAQDSRAVSTEAQRSLAKYCQWWPVGDPNPCYAPATFVFLRLSGETLRFTCRAHRDAWASRIRGPYLVLERAEWEVRGAGYCGVELGG